MNAPTLFDPTFAGIEATHHPQFNLFGDTTMNESQPVYRRIDERARLNLKAAGHDPATVDRDTLDDAIDQARAELVEAGHLTYVIRFASGRYYTGFDHDTGYAIGAPLCDEVQTFDTVDEAQAHIAGLPRWGHEHTVTAVSTEHFTDEYDANRDADHIWQNR